MQTMTRKYRNKIQKRSFQNLMNEAKELKDKRILTDFTLECEGDVFPVHRMVLAASSPYFRDYFTQQENLQQARITIDFIQSNILQIIVDYFYTGKINFKDKQSPELLKNVIHASAKLQISLLIKYCLELLLNNSFRNISLSDWQQIEELRSEKINKIFLTNILKKLSSFNESEAFLQLLPSQIHVLLFCPEAVDCDQIEILQSLLKWVKHSPCERQKYLKSFLEKVNFDRINPVFLLKLKDEHLLLNNIVFLTACSRLLFKKVENESTKKINEKPQATKSQISVHHSGTKGRKKLSLISDSLRSNLSISSHDYKIRFFIYRVGNGLPFEKPHLWLYDYTTDELKAIDSHPLNTIQQSSVIGYKGSIYCFGVFNEYIYKVDTNKWKKIRNSSYHQNKVTTVQLGNYIYVAGGFSCFSPVAEKSVECYDVDSDTWKDVAPLPALNMQLHIPIVAANDCLYAWLQTKLYKYIPGENKWYLVETELNVKLKTEEVHLATENSKIFIIEKSEPKTMWIYNPIDNSLHEDLIPSSLKDCDGIMNLNNPQNPEFLVKGNGKWFLYRPLLHSWVSFNPKKLNDFEISMLTLISN